MNPLPLSPHSIRSLLASGKVTVARVAKLNESLFRDEHPDLKHAAIEAAIKLCPLGQPGEERFVKEVWKTGKSLDAYSGQAIEEKALDAGYSRGWGPIWYDADGATNGCLSLPDFGGEWGKRRQAAHMPQWASRLTVSVTSVQVKRVGEVTEEEAIAMGYGSYSPAYVSGGEICGPDGEMPSVEFEREWDKANPNHPYASSPWAWLVTLERCK